MNTIALGAAASVAAGLATLSHVEAARASSEPIAHVRNAFDFTVRAPYDVAAPLFGPEAERAWAGPEWNPRFLYPTSSPDAPGSVFVVERDAHKLFWIATSFDLDSGHIQYVYVLDDLLVTLIDIHLSKPTPGQTGVSVVYERTALRPEGNERVERMGLADRGFGKKWSAAITDYLAKRRPRA